MAPMPLTPILRRTFAIFRERPLLFIALPLALGSIGLLEVGWFAKLPHALEVSCITILLFLIVVGIPLIYAMVASLTVQAQEQQPISARRAWLDVRRQSHLASTTFMLAVAAIGAVILLWFVAGLLGLLDPGIGKWLSGMAGGVVIFFIMVPFALAIPLVIIRRPAKTAEFSALDVSQRLSRGIILTIAAVLFLAACPNWAISGLGRMIHLPVQFAAPAHWAGAVLGQIVGAVSSALLYIALTLIAIDRSTADSLKEARPSATPEPHTAPQVVIL